jgi:cobalamin biosynthesis protein CobT
MWRYNTQQHRTVGDIPYRLLSGQVPRVGISSLLLDNALIDTLATEAQLNRVAEYDGMVDVVDSDQEVEAQEEEDNDNNHEGISNNDGDDEEDSNNVPMEDVVEEQVTQLEDGDDEEDSNNVPMEDVVEEQVTQLEAPAPTTPNFAGTFASANPPTDSIENSDDEDDDEQTLSQLGDKAVTNFKTTGDDNYTVWQIMVSELRGTVDREHLQRMKLKVSVAYCMNEKNIRVVASFVPAILVRLGQKLWELMDENDDHMEQLEWDGDNGIENMLGMYIKHPDASFCEYVKSLTRRQRL